MEEGKKEADLSPTKEAQKEEKEAQKEDINPQDIEPAQHEQAETSAAKDITQDIGHKERPAHRESKHMTVAEWLQAVKWQANPFIFSINPSLFVGYQAQIDRIMMALEEKHKFLLILGPTGSGKTTLLRWLQTRMQGTGEDVLYIGKPPQKPEEFVAIVSEKYPKSWYAFWVKKLTSIYQVPDFLNSKLRRHHLVILFDEAHEANTDVLEWLRVLNDQVENMSIVLSGLPSFEDQLRNNLETFVKRLTAKVTLLSLTKEETRELIAKRIQNVGGNGAEFAHDLVERIYDYTGGFPREVLRVCDELVNNAILHGRTHIEFDLHEKREKRVEAPANTPPIEKMTPMQKEVLELLSKKPLTPGQIANQIDLTKYKSRQHAVRSVNNVVKALHEAGYLERRKEEKAYVYSLSPRISTLFVKR